MESRTISSVVNKSGLCEVKKLRLILIIEANINFLDKLFIRVRMTNMVEKMKLITLEQYYGYMGNSDIESGINNNLFFVLIWMQRWTA